MKETFFNIKSTYHKARTGSLNTGRIVVDTPNYVFAATSGAVRALLPDEIKAAGVQIVIANTYHLHVSPGEDIVKLNGGLHKFMNWDGLIMTDSGGFQVFSLGKGRKFGVGKIGSGPDEKPLVQQKSGTQITEKGVYFKSHISGEKMFIGPVESMEIQKELGADIIFAFDECTSPFDTYEEVESALARTNRWQEIALKKYNKKQKLFGIIQGGSHLDLRKKSSEFVLNNPFDGIGIGGVLGANKLQMTEILSEIENVISKDKRPRHLLGMGDVDDIFIGVEQGIDLFDCVHPTRLARRGTVFINPPLGNSKNRWRYHITRSENKASTKPLDPRCRCQVCKTYTRSYIRHLFMRNEVNALRHISYHNVSFFTGLMREVRRAIDSHKLELLKRKWLD